MAGEKTMDKQNTLHTINSYPYITQTPARPLQGKELCALGRIRQPGHAKGLVPCSWDLPLQPRKTFAKLCSCSITLTTLKGGTWFPEIPLRLSHCLSLLPRNRQWEWACKGMSERKQEKQSEKCSCGKGAVFRLSSPKLQKYDAHMDNY